MTDDDALDLEIQRLDQARAATAARVDFVVREFEAISFRFNRLQPLIEALYEDGEVVTEFADPLMKLSNSFMELGLSLAETWKRVSDLADA